MTIGCGVDRATDEGVFFARLEASRAARLFTSQIQTLPATLAHGQTLRHRFTLTNPTDRPIRLLRAEALTPCCSSIRLETDAIAARGSATAEVEWRVGRTTGRKSTDYTIETDSADYPVLSLRLIADLWADWEAMPDHAGVPRIRKGETGELRLKIVSRRDDSNGLGPPIEVESSPPLHARLVESKSPPVPVAEGIREESAEVVATIDPSSEIGVHRGTIRFGWADGRQEERELAWEVAPPVQVQPATLFLARGEPTTKTVTIRSEGDPIHVLGATSPFLTGSRLNPEVLSDAHVIELDLIAPLDATDSAAVVRFETDSERQPFIDVNLILSPAQRIEVEP